VNDRKSIDVRRRAAFELACDLAREAHEDNFGSRRGIGFFEDVPNTLYLYDNNPYKGAPGQREAEHRELRECLARKGILVAGTARYPTWGTENGDVGEYTIATVFIAPDEHGLAALQDEWTRILDASYQAAEIFRPLIHPRRAPNRKMSRPERERDEGANE